MKRQNFDASTYTDYIKKRANTMLLESNNFERGKSIVSTPPSIRDTLSISLRSEFEKPIIVEFLPPPIEPVVPSVVTIIDDIPISFNDPGYGGDYFVGGSMTITWNCIPPSEVTVQLYVATLNFDEFLGYLYDTEYTIRETITTTETSHTFSVEGYGLYYFFPYGSRGFIVITPRTGEPVTGRRVVLLNGL